MIYVMGDSHVTMLANEGVFELLCSESFTAFSLHEKDKKIRESLIGIDKEAIILFVYGEIDCRYRIFYCSSSKKIGLDLIIDNTVQSYLDYVDILRKEQNNVWVLSVVPTQKYGGPTRGDPVFTLPNGDGGGDEDRRYITEVLNSKLKYECFKRNIPFIDIYCGLVGKDGFNRKEKTRDGMHYKYVGDIVLERIKEIL